MSVHAEYGRALDALLTSVQKLETTAAIEWVSGLTQARVRPDLDLSTAAKACLRVLASIDAERSLSQKAGIGPDVDPLREPFARLHAHCRAVLGTADSTAE